MVLHRFRARALYLFLRSPTNLSASHASPVVSLNRLLCSAASSSSQVAAEDFLVSRCGLTRAQAVKASKKISHLSSLSQPEALVAFLRDTLGVPVVDVAALVALDPRFLCADVERTVAPRVAELSDLGLSREQIARLIPLAPNSFRSRFLRRNFEFWLNELGSFDKLLLALRRNSSLLSTDLDKVAAPNVAFLRQCGVHASEIVAFNIYSARLFTMNSKYLEETVERLEELGIKRGARMFPRALVIISLLTKEAVTRRIQLLVQNFGFSQRDALEIVRKVPGVLGLSDNKIQGNMEFLIKDAALDLSYIARRPALLMYSVARRLLPRRCLLKLLSDKGFMKNTQVDYYFTASMSEKDFLRKFVLSYQDSIPGIADHYASICSGN